MKHNDPVDLIRDRNPVPDAHQLPDGPNSASAEALFEEIIGMNDTRTRTFRGRRRTLLLAAAFLVLGAAAAGAGLLAGGDLPEPAFSGETWILTVGEEANDEDGTSFKVCQKFEPPGGGGIAGGLGTAWCGVWPSDEAGVILDVVPAVDTPEGIVLFIDLSTEPVATVSLLMDDGSTVEVAPFVMPASGKQYAAVEIADDATRRVTISALDDEGNVMERQEVSDLSVTK